MLTIIKLNPFLYRLMRASQLLRTGRYSVLFNELRKQFNSESLSLGLQKDLKQYFPLPKAKINISIRGCENEDIDELLGPDTQDPLERRAISDQKGILNAAIPGCFVAVADDGRPCYMQWLISSECNDVVAGHFGGLFPSLKKSEALLEGAYTPPAFRGKGIMSAAMAQIANKASDNNANIVCTFVDINNIASLKGCKRAGFTPYVLRKERWFMFHRTITFCLIPEELIARTIDC